MVGHDATGGVSAALGRPVTVAAGRRSQVGRTQPVGSVAVLLGRVAEWQTRWLQVPVRETSWGFKSPLAHHGAPAQAGARVRFRADFYRIFYRTGMKRRLDDAPRAGACSCAPAARSMAVPGPAGRACTSVSMRGARSDRTAGPRDQPPADDALRGREHRERHASATRRSRPRVCEVGARRWRMVTGSSPDRASGAMRSRRARSSLSGRRSPRRLRPAHVARSPTWCARRHR